MHKNIFQPKQFAHLANCTAACVWLQAQAAQLTSQLSLSRTRCNLIWQQLGDKLVWDTTVPSARTAKKSWAGSPSLGFTSPPLFWLSAPLPR